ncbi:MAG: ribonuclease E inhibitor RraB [Steroidobacteraceae bacterium]
MRWLSLLLIAAAMAAVLRIFFNLRRLRNQPTDDWDSRQIARLKAAGADPFSSHDCDFFFALPDAESAAAVEAHLRAMGYEVDTRELDGDDGHRYSVHAKLAVRLQRDEMQERSKSFRELAERHGGRYDGWAAAGR